MTFGGAPSMPPIPEEEPPAPMPDPEDEVLKKRKRQKAASQRVSGRASTILSESGGGESLGGGY